MARATMSRWQFWIDRGGTFTDVVDAPPGRDLHTLKLLSENPANMTTPRWKVSGDCWV